MNILFATTEAVPFCKTGGLGDVCGALPVELELRGERPAVVLPAFQAAFESGLPIERTGVEYDVPIGGRNIAGRILQSKLPGTNVPVYLIDQPSYFLRPELYRERGSDYADNCERFIFFCRSVLVTIERLLPQTEVVHCHDWPTGLVPVYLKTLPSNTVDLERIASLFTIHNLAYQGNFWHWDMPLTGLDWKYFNWQQMEFYGQLNFMKSALAFADMLSTVSPRYAREIQGPPQGAGLEGVLAHRKEDLVGVLNGCDYREWNPATDPHIAARYDHKSVSEGKPACKRALQAEFGLPERADVPLLSIIGRLADQKGLDLVTAILPQLLRERDVQFVVLGTGEPRYHEILEQFAVQFPDRFAVRLEFSNPLAHRIEAGADMFLMPSHYEPCGLNQLYSLRYGTVPVVRATGGLADTVIDATDEELAHGTATGVSFEPYTVEALRGAIERALVLYGQADRWRQLILAGMQQDWSWARSAETYSHLYRRTQMRSQMLRSS